MKTVQNYRHIHIFEIIQVYIIILNGIWSIIQLNNRFIWSLIDRDSTNTRAVRIMRKGCNPGGVFEIDVKAPSISWT